MGSDFLLIGEAQHMEYLIEIGVNNRVKIRTQDL